MSIFDYLRRFFSSTIADSASAGGAKTANLEDDVQAMSAWIATALNSSGYQADFSPDSINEIERFFSEHSRRGEAIPGGLLTENVGAKLFALGSYCGEVLRRELGGIWLTDDDDPEGEINIAVQLPGGTLFWPAQRVMKRMDSEDNSLTRWATVIRRDFQQGTVRSH